jgi:hypothetical protein
MYYNKDLNTLTCKVEIFSKIKKYIFEAVKDLRIL